MPGFVIRLGNLIIAKTTCEKDGESLTVKELPISALIHLDKHPKLLKDPKRLLKEISLF